MAWVKIDEHFYDHPKWCDAPGDSIALWLALIAWCNRNDSDTGFIPETKTTGLVNVKNVRNTLADLCARKAIRKVRNGYTIHDYTEFQQPEKVREIAAKRAAAGRKGAANKWAERRRAAEYADAPPPPDPMANDMASAIANASPGPLANGWPDTDTDTDDKQLSSVSTSEGHHPTDDDDFQRTVQLIVEARMNGRAVNKPRAYAMTARTNTITEDGELIRRMLNDGTPPETVALFVLGHGIAQQAEQAHNPIPWCTPDCIQCDGDAWIHTSHGLTPCPQRTPQPRTGTTP